MIDAAKDNRRETLSVFADIDLRISTRLSISSR